MTTAQACQMPSATTIGKTYRVDATSCECDGFKYRGHCRHHDAYLADLASLRNAYRCRNCGVDAAAPGRAFCAGCAHVLSQFAAEANAPTWTPVAHCVRCSAAYTWTEESPLLCPTCAASSEAA